MQDVFLYALVVVFVFSGLWFLFGLGNSTKSGISTFFKSIISKIKDFNRLEQKLEERYFRLSERHEQRIRIAMLTGKKESVVERVRRSVTDVILSNNHQLGFVYFTIATIVLAVLSFVIGELYLKNFVVSIILGCAGAVVPYIYLEYMKKRFEKDKNEKLLVVMGNLSSAYLVNDTFIAAVEEVLPTIPEPLKKHFDQFVADANFYKSDQITQCMIKLTNKIDNFYFTEFMQMVMNAEKGESGLKYTIKSIPVDYQVYLEVNAGYSRQVSQENVKFLLNIVLLPIFVGFIRLFDAQYFEILTKNIIGKITLTLVFVVFVVGAILFRKYNKDIKLEL